MVAKKESETLFSVEMLRDNTRLDEVIFAGVCAEQKWYPGKRVSKQVFDESVLKFIGKQKGKKVC